MWKGIEKYMQEKITFKRPVDLSVTIGDSDIILRKGFLHINEVIIDKLLSSKEFVDAISELDRNGTITVPQESKICDDLLQLNQLGFIQKSVGIKNLLIVNEKIYDSVSRMIPENVIISKVNDILNREEILTINENKDAKKCADIYGEKKSVLNNYDYTYVIDSFANITTLRAFNRISFANDMDITFGFYDNENIYVTNVKPGVTGCFECLEKHIISKFPNTLKYYLSRSAESNSDTNEVSVPELLLLTGIILKDMDNVKQYGNTSLGGQVIHYYLPNFEYSYNVNRRHVSCISCAGINRAMFEEQNVKAINLIKEEINNDKV